MTFPTQHESFLRNNNVLTFTGNRVSVDNTNLNEFSALCTKMQRFLGENCKIKSDLEMNSVDEIAHKTATLAKYQVEISGSRVLIVDDQIFNIEFLKC